MEWISIKERLPEFVNEYEEKSSDGSTIEVENVSENMLLVISPIGDRSSISERCHTIGNFRRIENFKVGSNGEKIKINPDEEDFNISHSWFIELDEGMDILTNDKGIPNQKGESIEITHWAVLPELP